MIDSRRLADLHPTVEALARKFIAACAAEGIKIIVTSTYRDAEKQNALFAQGRTKPGKRVTNARAGDSYHNWKCAFDIVPEVDGKLVWNTSGEDGKLWHRIAAIGKSFGLEWGGDWMSLKDFPHFQYTEGLKLADFKAGKHLAAYIA